MDKANPYKVGPNHTIPTGTLTHRPFTMGSVNNNCPTPSSATQARLFQITNEVALKYSQEYQWSPWYSWNIINDLEYDRRYGIRGMERHFWSPTKPFGSCLGASTNVLIELQAELTSDLDFVVRRYANYVQQRTSRRARHIRQWLPCRRSYVLR